MFLKVLYMDDCACEKTSLMEIGQGHRMYIPMNICFQFMKPNIIHMKFCKDNFVFGIDKIIFKYLSNDFCFLWHEKNCPICMAYDLPIQPIEFNK